MPGANLNFLYIFIISCHVGDSTLDQSQQKNITILCSNKWTSFWKQFNFQGFYSIVEAGTSKLIHAAQPSCGRNINLW